VGICMCWQAAGHRAGGRLAVRYVVPEQSLGCESNAKAIQHRSRWESVVGEEIAVAPGMRVGAAPCCLPVDPPPRPKREPQGSAQSSTNSAPRRAAD